MGERRGDWDRGRSSAFWVLVSVVFAWRRFWEVLGMNEIGDTHRMVAWLAVIVAVVLWRT